MKLRSAPAWKALRNSVSLGILGAAVAGGIWRSGRPRHRDLAERLSRFPRWLPSQRNAVRVHWNDHQVPFVVADDDYDLALVLGAVHAHLRLVQIDFMRRIAEGRVAEAVGPAAVELDHALRLLNLGRAVPEIDRRLPQETRTWLEGFARGINGYIDQMPEPPYELAVLGLEPKPWNVRDLLRLGRLAATDFTWKVWLRLYRLRQRPDWDMLWQRLVGTDAIPVPSFTGESAGAGAYDWLLSAFDRSGSNSLAVAPGRSASGAPLIASDPHLSIMLPNLWLTVGYRSPGHHAVGLMIPGVPAIALGRNPWIAWGGTSLHAASSELFDASDLDSVEIAERREAIPVRWSRAREVTLRETKYGPIISDASMFGDNRERPLALRWVGHEPTDEVTAMLRISRSRSWEEFREALDGFAIPAQNMIYADVTGRIGQAMAAKLPRRPAASPPMDMVAPVEAARHWCDPITAQELPIRVDPPEGFVASANDAPAQAPVAIGFFFSPNDRVNRIRQVLSGKTRISVEDLVRLQNDVVMPSARGLRDEILRVLCDAHASDTAALAKELHEWDGAYDSDSHGALAFELTAYHLVAALHGREMLSLYQATWDPWALLRDDLATADRTCLADAARLAAGRAAKALRKLGTWGAAHRLCLAHPFESVPLLGRRFRIADLPAGGSNETLMKTAFGFSGGRHRVRLGANARHISDLSDVDANYFVLLGGQDGWLGSSTFADQVALWRRAALIRVPLAPETVRAEFSYTTNLEPGVPASR